MLHDDIAAALPELRAHAESLMVDSCAIARRRLDEDGVPVREMDPVLSLIHISEPTRPY